jgi:hypothetical protein
MVAEVKVMIMSADSPAIKEGTVHWTVPETGVAQTTPVLVDVELTYVRSDGNVSVTVTGETGTVLELFFADSV